MFRVKVIGGFRIRVSVMLIGFDLRLGLLVDYEVGPVLS